MKYLFWAAFVLLLDVSVSQDVEVPCQNTNDCKSLSDAPPQVTCHGGFCKCIDDRGSAQNCVSQNATLLTEARLDAGGLIGRTCSLEKDCATVDKNSYCNTTRKQCACNIGFVASIDNQRCLAAVQYNNSGCEIAKQCLSSTANTTCTSDGVCLCDINYHYASGSCWATKEFGSNCSTTEECAHVQEAVCDNQSRCNCPVDRVIDPKTTACLSIASKIDDDCVESIQCSQLLGEGGACVEDRCQCREHFHHSTDAFKCLPNLDIGAECQTDEECLNGLEEGHGPMRCLMNQCACAEGFQGSDGKCQAVKPLEDKSGGIRLAGVSAFAMTCVILLSSVL